MKTPEDQQLIGEIVTSLHKRLRSQQGRPPLIDSAAIGGLLWLAKRSLPPRRYIPWLKQHTPIGQRQGARYIARLREFVATKEQREQLEQADAELLQTLIAKATAGLKKR